MRGTLNAEVTFPLHSGAEVAIDGVELDAAGRVASLDFIAEQGGVELWRTLLSGMEPDSTTMASDINTVDYKVFEWPVANLVVVAGEAQACLLRSADGVVQRVLRLGMTGVSSLDFIEIRELRDSELLVIVTSKVAWLVGPTGVAKGPYEFGAPIESVLLNDKGEVVLRVYDVGDPALPIVEYVLGGSVI